MPTKKTATKKDRRPLRTYGWLSDETTLYRDRDPPRYRVTGRGYDLADAFEKLSPAKQKKAAACECVREVESEPHERHVKILAAARDIADLRLALTHCALANAGCLFRAVARHTAHDPVFRAAIQRIAGIPGVHAAATKPTMKDRRP